jgi:hypothetical protein
MDPLRSLDPAALRAVRVIAFDVDDTVTRRGQLEAVAFDAMWRAARAGIHLFAVTGRPLGWADVVARHWPVRAAVGENGAGWVYRSSEGHVHESYFHSDAGERARQAAVLAQVVASVGEEMPYVRLATDQRARRCDIAFDIGEEDVLEGPVLHRLLRTIERGGAHATVSSVHAHVVAGDWDKAKGVVAAAADTLTAVPEESEWLYIGDSGNDEAAFAFFTSSIGVSNVREHVGALAHPPRYVTDGDRGIGFAEVIDLVLAAQASSGDSENDPR